MMTPRQAAKSLVSYSRHHEDDGLRTFVIPQVPGSIPHSTRVDGVVESLVKSKKYVVPLAMLYPFVTGTLIAAYLTDARFHPDRDAAVFNPATSFPPGEIVSLHSATALGKTVATSEQPHDGFIGSRRQP
ncbi:MAG TPA: hypothetical protein VHX37_07130 [Acidobacteriaceae bacterium]|jgi:hypothetical protein|nr:hypothetical protein [Acidobacteriaceae bacterium]